MERKKRKKLIEKVYQKHTYLMKEILGGKYKMDKISGIYVITNQINGKQYVGLSKNCLKRWFDHYSKSYHSTKKEDKEKVLYMAMRKYGRDNFSFQIIEECPENKLSEREKYWINKLDTYKNGYNETLGGETSGPKNVHIGEEHGMAKLTEQDVIKCRKWYQEGKASKEIWEQYYKEIMTYSGFQKMWEGKTWKHVMPEVFEKNPRPRRKYSDELVQEIKRKYNEDKMSCAEIYHFYNEEISRTTINNICNNRR